MNEELELNKLGQRIKELRIAAGYDTPEAFAKDYDIPIEEYLLYEQGVDMDLLTVLALTMFLGITPTLFFKGL
ncbi:MAG: hypothetical protein R2800_11530 [Flavipsychrobacter sp.]